MSRPRAAYSLRAPSPEMRTMMGRALPRSRPHGQRWGVVRCEWRLAAPSAEAFADWLGDGLLLQRPGEPRPLPVLAHVLRDAVAGHDAALMAGHSHPGRLAAFVHRFVATAATTLAGIEGRLDGEVWQPLLETRLWDLMDDTPIALSQVRRGRTPKAAELVPRCVRFSDWRLLGILREHRPLDPALVLSPPPRALAWW